MYPMGFWNRIWLAYFWTQRSAAVIKNSTSFPTHNKTKAQEIKKMGKDVGQIKIFTNRLIRAGSIVAQTLLEK